MFANLREKVQQRIASAHAEATWIVAGLTEKLLLLRSKKVKEPEFDDPIRALVYYSNPDFGLQSSVVREKIREAMLRGMGMLDQEKPSEMPRTRRIVREVFTA